MRERYTVLQLRGYFEGEMDPTPEERADIMSLVRQLERDDLKLLYYVTICGKLTQAAVELAQPTTTVRRRYLRILGQMARKLNGDD